jgi:hypothetical protein
MYPGAIETCAICGAQHVGDYEENHDGETLSVCFECVGRRRVDGWKPYSTITLHVFQDWKIDAQAVLEDCERFSKQFCAPPYSRESLAEYFGILLHGEEAEARIELAREAMRMLSEAKPTRTIADLHGLDVSRYVALCVAAGPKACEHWVDHSTDALKAFMSTYQA